MTREIHSSWCRYIIILLSPRFDLTNLFEVSFDYAFGLQKKYAFEHATVRRLRSKLRDKEKLLMSLQTAIEDACETALDQQNKDRKEIENLHGVFSMKDNRSLEEIKLALKVG